MSVRSTTANAGKSPSNAPIRKRSSVLVFLLAANLIAAAVLLAPSSSRQLGIRDTPNLAGEPELQRSPVAPPLGQKKDKLTAVHSTAGSTPTVTPTAARRSHTKLASNHDRNLDGRPSREVLRSQARQLMENRSYRVAIEVFKEVVQLDTKLPQGLLAYEMAVGFEMLGDNSLAHRHYQLAASSQQQSVRQAAMLGQSRMLRDRGDRTEAMHLLSRLLLQTHNAAGRKSGIAAQVQYHWAELHVLSETKASKEDLLSRDRPVHPGLSISSKVLLDLAGRHDAAAAPESSHVLEADGIEILGVRRSHPDIVSVTARFEQVGLVQLLEKCADALGYEFNIPHEMRANLSSQAVAVEVSDMSVSNLLRLVLHSTHAEWSYDAATHTLALQHRVATQSKTAPASVAELALRGALAMAPNHEHAGGAFTMLGNLSFTRNQIDDAMSKYRDVAVRYRKQRTKQIATFNLSKCLMQKGQRDEARQGLYSVIDKRSGHEIEPASHVFLGEMFLCERNGKAAVREFTRAVSLSKSKQLKGLASLALSLSYLQSGNSRMANSALMSTRSILREPAFRNATALLSAYANYRSAANDDEMMRFGRAMTSAIAHVAPEDFFGVVGYILLSDVYAELGMTEQTADMQRAAIEANAPQPLRDEFVFELGRHHLLESDHPDFVDAMQELRSSGANNWPHQAQLQLAEFALRQGHSQECVKICRRLVNESKTTQDKADGLRLLGRAYEKRKDHHNAAICFAGMLPTQTTNWDVPITSSSFQLNAPGG